jgi:23S rRNA pseudouridine2605 synthase
VTDEELQAPSDRNDDRGDQASGEAGRPQERDHQEHRPGGVYLSVYLARSGVGSRRYCDDVVKQGRVTVNGDVVSFPREQVGSTDEVAVDGDVVTPRELRYVLVNKPRGVASTRSDPHAERVLVDMVPNGRVLFPVGRLDVDSTGLIILTNDGVLANRLMHPRYGVPKTYVARVQGRVSRRDLGELRHGVELEDGVSSPSEARLIKQSPKTALVELTLREGRKRQVRRMLAALRLPVDDLHRRRYGPLSDKGLAVGQHRELTQEEVDALRRAGEESDRQIRAEDPEQALGPETAVEP